MANSMSSTEYFYWQLAKCLFGIFDWKEKYYRMEPVNIGKIRLVEIMQKHYPEMWKYTERLLLTDNRYGGDLGQAHFLSEIFILSTTEKVSEVLYLENLYNYCLEYFKENINARERTRQYNIANGFYWGSDDNKSSESWLKQIKNLKFNNSPTMNLVQKIKNSELQDTDKILVEKGAMTSAGEPTKEGIEVLQYVLFKENKEKIAKLIN